MSSQRERLAARAYDLWVRRGRPVGSPEIDWYAAEKELLANANAPTQPKDVVTTDSDRGPVATDTETTAPDGPIPKRSRPGRNSARQTRNNGASGEQ